MPDVTPCPLLLLMGMKEKVSPLNSGFNRSAKSVVLSITGLDGPVLQTVFLGICRGKKENPCP